MPVKIARRIFCFYQTPRIALFVRSSVRSSVRNKISAASCMMQHSQGSRNIDICIRLLESPCSSVRPFVRPSPKSTASYIQHQSQGGTQIYASYMYVSGSSLMDKCIIHMHHSHVYQDRICIIHACIRVKGHGYMHHG